MLGFRPQLPLYGIGIVLTACPGPSRFPWPVPPAASSLTVIVVYVGFTATQVGGHRRRRQRRCELLRRREHPGWWCVTVSVIPVRRLRMGLRPGFGFHRRAGRIGGLRGRSVAVASQQVALIVSLNRSLRRGHHPGVYNLARPSTCCVAVLGGALAVAAYRPGRSQATGDEETYGRHSPRVRGVLLFGASARPR